MKQGEPEVFHARDRVGQTSGATQRDLKPGCSERIGNSRRTGGPCRAEQCPFGLPLPGLGPASSGGLTTNSRRTGEDATTALDLLTAVNGPLVRVTADAAYDTVAVYETETARGATVIIPPAKTANISSHGPRSPARDRTITLVKQLGRRRWKKVSGYHRQGRVENAFFRYKSIIGPVTIRATTPLRGRHSLKRQLVRKSPGTSLPAIFNDESSP